MKHTKGGAKLQGISEEGSLTPKQILKEEKEGLLNDEEVLAGEEDFAKKRAR
jgi:hypothetical protein